MPAIRPGARGAVITGWGTALPAEDAHQPRPRRHGPRHERRVDRRAHRHPRAPRRRHDRRAVGRGRPAGARHVRARPGVDRRRRSWPPRRPTARCRRRRRRSPHELGLRCGAFDVNAACSGFTYALVVAHGLIAIGAERLLVIGTDTLARITDWEDRNTAMLFADGSGAVVLEAVDGPRPAARLGPRRRRQRRALPLRRDRRHASRWTARRSSAGPCGSWSTRPQKSMAHAGVTADDIALVVPHQANIRIIKAACDRLGIADGPGRRRARPHRQHVVGVDPARPRRRPRQRPGRTTATSCCSSASAPA